MSADDKFPRWVRVSTIDSTTPAGRYILAGHDKAAWADYGRYFALLQLVAREADACMDVSDDRRMRSLAAELNMTVKACESWLDMLVEAGAVERESYERGLISIQDATNAARGYREQCARNRQNGAKSKGRPRKDDAGTKTQT